MGAPEKLTLIRADWNALAAGFLDPALAAPPAGWTLKRVKEEVEEGNALLFHVQDGNETVGAVVVGLRPDKIAVILAAGGDLPGCNLTFTVLPFIEAVARKMGALALRFTTRRPGLVRRIMVSGFCPTRYTVEKHL